MFDMIFYEFEEFLENLANQANKNITENKKRYDMKINKGNPGLIKYE